MIKTRITEDNSTFVGVKLGTRSTTVYIHNNDFPLEPGKTIRYSKGIPDKSEFAIIEEMLTEEMPLLDLDGSITTFMNTFPILYTNKTNEPLLHNGKDPCRAGKRINNRVVEDTSDFLKENWEICNNCTWPIEIKYIKKLLD